MVDKSEQIKEPRYCPYCDEEIAEVTFPYGEICKVTMFYCPKCHKPLPRTSKVCPDCGADIKG